MKNKSGINSTYVDRPDLPETFADSFGSMSFDGQVMKIEMRTTRQGPITPPNPPENIQTPACRLVLSPKATIELYNNLQLIMDKLEKDGVFTKRPAGESEMSH